MSKTISPPPPMNAFAPLLDLGRTWLQVTLTAQRAALAQARQWTEGEDAGRSLRASYQDWCDQTLEALEPVLELEQSARQGLFQVQTRLIELGDEALRELERLIEPRAP